MGRPTDSIFTGTKLAAIQRQLTMADGLVQKPAGSYLKSLVTRPGGFSRATITKMTLEQGSGITIVTVVVTNSNGVENPEQTYEVPGLTIPSAKASGETVAMLMTTKRQHGEMCGRELEEFAKIASKGDHITFARKGETITVTTN